VNFSVHPAPIEIRGKNGERNPGTQYLIGLEEGDVGYETTYFLKAKR
jgi:hypothetical protein